LVLVHHWRARGRSGIERKNIQPPLHDAIGFGKKAMAADIDAVAFVVDRARDTAEVVALFEDERNDRGTGQQLIGGGKTCRAGSDNDRTLRLTGDCCHALLWSSLAVAVARSIGPPKRATSAPQAAHNEISTYWKA